MPAFQLRHNVVLNLCGSMVPILVTAVTVPRYIEAIGAGRFGLLTLIWLAFGYFGVFDLGLSRATAYRLATLRDAHLAVRTSVFYTACALNLTLGVGAATIFAAFAGPLSSSFTSDPAFQVEVLQALPWVALFFPLGLLGGVLGGCLQSTEQFLELNVQQSVGSVLLQSLPLAAVYVWGPSLQPAVLGAIVARLISVAWLAIVCLRWARPAGRPVLRLAHVRDLFSYGGWITVSDMIAPLLNGLDQLVIGATLGPKATAFYSVPFSMASKAMIIPASLTRAVFPRMSTMAAGDAMALSLRSLSVLAYVMALVCAPAMLLSRLALELWIGVDFARESHLAASVLLLGIWLNSVGFIPYTLLQARGRPDLIAKIHAYELLPFLILLFVLIHQFGLIGAAVAWCVRIAADMLLQARFAGYDWGTARPVLFPGVLVGVAMATCCTDPDGLAAIGCALLIALMILLRFSTLDDFARYTKPAAWLR